MGKLPKVAGNAIASVEIRADKTCCVRVWMNQVIELEAASPEAATHTKEIINEAFANGIVKGIGLLQDHVKDFMM